MPSLPPVLVSFGLLCSACSGSTAQPDRDLGALIAPLIGGLVVVAFATHAFLSGRRHGADAPEGDDEPDR